MVSNRRQGLHKEPMFEGRLERVWMTVRSVAIVPFRQFDHVAGGDVGLTEACAETNFPFREVTRSLGRRSCCTCEVLYVGVVDKSHLYMDKPKLHEVSNLTSLQ